MNLDDYTGAQLAANPRLARAWNKEAKRLGFAKWAREKARQHRLESRIENPKSKIP